MQRECSAVEQSVLLDCPYFERSQLTIHTDHDAFKWIFNLSDFIGRVPRGRLRISKFDFDVVHCANIKQHPADTLLQLSTSGKNNISLEDNLPLYAIDNPDNSHILLHTVAHKKYHARSVANIKPADDKTKYKPSTAAKIIRVRQQDIFCSTTATQVG